MPVSPKQLVAASVAALCTVLTSCSDVHESTKERVHVPDGMVSDATQRRGDARTVRDVGGGNRPVGRAVNAMAVADAALVHFERDERELREARWLIAVAVETVRRKPLGRASAVTVSTSSLPITGDYHLWPDWPLWHAVGLCEQRGDSPDGIAWHGSPAGGEASSGYPGGLGLSRDFWWQFAPIAGVATTNGADASPAEQIRVARAGSHDGTRMGGWSSWGSGCIQRTMRTGH